MSPTTSTARTLQRPTLRPIPDLYARDPGARLAAARAVKGHARRSALKRVREWPAYSPGAANAWLLLVTTKAPTWRDHLVLWQDDPPALGDPHPGFFYPDPLGFWTEVRRWATQLVGLSTTEALSVSALLHIGEDASLVAWAEDRCSPMMTVFLDEAARATTGAVGAEHVSSIPDPHRPGTVYEGWWGHTPDGRVVGKAPQHPASHLLYRTEDMDAYLASAPAPTG